MALSKSQEKAASQLSKAFGGSGTLTSAQRKATEGASSTFKSSGGGSGSKNPLVFDSPAYHQQFGSNASNYKGSGSASDQALERDIQDFRMSNPNLVADAAKFGKFETPIRPENMVTDAPVPFQAAPTNIPGATGLIESIGETQQASQAIQTEEDAQKAEVIKQNEALNQLAQRFDPAEMYEDLQKETGANDIRKQLQQANLTLSQMQSEYQKTNQSLQQQQVPTPFIIGQQNELAETAAIKIGAQASYVQALQGNLELANHYVDKMIDLEQKNFEVKYQTATNNLNLAMTFLERGDQKRAQELQFKMDLAKTEHSQFTSDKSIGMKNALLNGAPQSVVQEIAASKNVAELQSAGGKYLTDSLAASQLQTQRLQQIQIQQEIAAANDVDSGILDDQDIKNIDNSPQGKKINALVNFKSKLNRYQQLVEEYGTEAFGKDKQALDSAYTEVQLEYKNVAELGVLAGPDMELIESAIKDATPGFWGQVGNIVTFGGNTRAVKTSIDEAQNAINTAAQYNSDTLYARNPKYEQSDYVQALMLPFQNDLVTPTQYQEMDSILMGTEGFDQLLDTDLDF